MSLAEAAKLPAGLNRPFRALVFNWDGAAGLERPGALEDFSRHAIEASELGMILVGITDAGFPARCVRGIGKLAASAPGALYFGHFGGAEVYRMNAFGDALRLSWLEGSPGLRWVRDWVLGPRKIDLEEVLLLEGDAHSRCLRDSELQGASIVDFGEAVRRNLSPLAWLSEVLRAQVALLRGFPLLDSLDSDPAWSLEQDGFEASRERDVESLFSIANGRIGTRGALSIPIASSQEDLFVAGIYGCKVRRDPYSEVEFLDPQGRNGEPFAERAPIPSPLRVRLERESGDALSIEKSVLPAFRRLLEFKSGVLHEWAEWRGERQRVRIHLARCVNLARLDLIQQEIEVFVDEGEPVKVILPREIPSPDRTLQFPHLRSVSSDSNGLVRWDVEGAGHRVVIAGRTFVDTALSNADSWTAVAGTPLRIRRAITLSASRYSGDPEGSVQGQLDSLASVCAHHSAFFAHRSRWARFWRASDIELPSRPEIAEASRFQLFQVRCAASPDEIASIGARGLSGRAYEGHVFWDAEIFVQPVLLATEPELARRGLDYRFRTLEGAKRNARLMGCEGACFAWESTVLGDDVTPSRLMLKSLGKSVPIFTGKQQIHVTADVAYAIERYWRATGDLEWLRWRGVRILVETARFWSSRVRERGSGGFSILGVVGPDEYHSGVDDNAYTNWMAQYHLRLASCWARRLPASARAPEVEIRRWESIADRIQIAEPRSSDGVIEQFRGYFQLEPLPPDQKGQILQAPLQRLLAWKQTQASQLIKQADVLMIPFLFPDAWSRERIRANFEYYEPRTDHGSSLSPSVHATLAARIDDYDRWRRYFDLALHLDLKDLMSNTALGLHLANMGGVWQCLNVAVLQEWSRRSPEFRARFENEFGRWIDQGGVSWPQKPAIQSA